MGAAGRRRIEDEAGLEPPGAALPGGLRRPAGTRARRPACGQAPCGLRPPSQPRPLSQPLSRLDLSAGPPRRLRPSLGPGRAARRGWSGTCGACSACRPRRSGGDPPTCSGSEPGGPGRYCRLMPGRPGSRRSWLRRPPASGYAPSRPVPWPPCPRTRAAPLIRAADEILAGRWEVLGVVRADMVDPDWFLDPLSGEASTPGRVQLQHRPPRRGGHRQRQAGLGAVPAPPPDRPGRRLRADSATGATPSERRAPPVLVAGRTRSCPGFTGPAGSSSASG